MKAPADRRTFLTTIAATTGLGALSGCLSGLPRRGSGAADRTVYVGAYHWGFVLLDEDGVEHERVVLDRGSTVRLVAFNTGAERALQALPSPIQDAVPDHHDLEERNEGRIPSPGSGELHERLEAANARYPDHSVAVMPSGANQVGGMRGGMMLHPVPLPRDAGTPTSATLAATQRGDYTLSCLTYCGYGHAYMDLDSALVVR